MVSRSVNTKSKFTLDNPIISRYLEDLHDQFVIVPADKVPNNVVLFVSPSITVAYIKS